MQSDINIYQDPSLKGTWLENPFGLKFKTVDLRIEQCSALLKHHYQDPLSESTKQNYSKYQSRSCCVSASTAGIAAIPLGCASLLAQSFKPITYGVAIPTLIGAVTSLGLWISNQRKSCVRRSKIKSGQEVIDPIKNELRNLRENDRGEHLVSLDFIRKFRGVFRRFDEGFKKNVNLEQARAILTVAQINEIGVDTLIRHNHVVERILSPKFNESESIKLLKGKLFVKYLSEDPSLFSECIRAFAKRELLTDSVVDGVKAVLPDVILEQVSKIRPLLERLIQGEDLLSAIHAEKYKQSIDREITDLVIHINQESLHVDRKQVLECGGEVMERMLCGFTETPDASEITLSIPNLKAATLKKLIYWKNHFSQLKLNDDEIDSSLAYADQFMLNSLQVELDTHLSQKFRNLENVDEQTIGLALSRIERYGFLSKLREVIDNRLAQKYSKEDDVPELELLAYLNKWRMKEAVREGRKKFFESTRLNDIKRWIGLEDKALLEKFYSAMSIAVNEDEKLDFFELLVRQPGTKRVLYLSANSQSSNLAGAFCRKNSDSVSFWFGEDCKPQMFIDKLSSYMDLVNDEEIATSHCVQYLCNRIKNDPDFLFTLHKEDLASKAPNIWSAFIEGNQTVICKSLIQSKPAFLSAHLTSLITFWKDIPDVLLSTLSEIIKQKPQMLQLFWESDIIRKRLEGFLLEECKVYQNKIYQIWDTALPDEVDSYLCTMT